MNYCFCYGDVCSVGAVSCVRCVCGVFRNTRNIIAKNTTIIVLIITVVQSSTCLLLYNHIYQRSWILLHDYNWDCVWDYVWDYLCLDYTLCRFQIDNILDSTDLSFSNRQIDVKTSILRLI